MLKLIGPGTVITMDGQGPDGQGRVLENGGVVTESGLILAVGEFDELQERFPEARIINAGGGTIMPGLINAHGHFYGMFARGMNLKDPPPETFQQVLDRIWWRLDKALDERGVYLSAALEAIRALRAGTTAIIDHHASPGAIEGSLDLVAEATQALGIRASLCYEVSDRDGRELALAGIKENLRFAQHVGRAAGQDGMLAARFGLHAGFTIGPETMAAAVRAESDLGVGFHIHCAEGPEDGAIAQARYGKSPVRRLYDEGILGPRSLLAHCVHVDEADMALLEQTASTVTHQPHSNMGNAVGWSRILRMQELGVHVALGTDGYTFDMIETMRTAAALHSHQTRIPGAGVGPFAGLLLTNNAKLASAMFGRKLGVLEPGAAADLIILDYYPPTPLTPGNVPWHIQFGMSAAHVRTSMVNGRVVMRDREIVGLDELELAMEARQVALATWERF